MFEAGLLFWKRFVGEEKKGKERTGGSEMNSKAELLDSLEIGDRLLIFRLRKLSLCSQISWLREPGVNCEQS